MSCCGAFLMPYENPGPALMRAKKERPLTGRLVLAICVCFFGVIAAVNGVMMTLAIRTMPGLDVANGYVASQEMNSQIEAMRQQAERGWQVAVQMKLDGDSAPVDITIADKQGAPVGGLEVVARLAHPAVTRADHDIVLREIGPGHYIAVFPEVHPGAWTLITAANRNGERLFASHNRINLEKRRS